MASPRVMRFPVPEGSQHVGNLQVMIEDLMARRNLYAGTRRSSGNAHDPSFFIQATNRVGERNLAKLEDRLTDHPNIVWDWQEDSPAIQWY